MSYSALGYHLPGRRYLNTYDMPLQYDARSESRSMINKSAFLIKHGLDKVSAVLTRQVLLIYHHAFSKFQRILVGTARSRYNFEEKMEITLSNVFKIIIFKVRKSKQIALERIKMKGDFIMYLMRGPQISLELKIKTLATYGRLKKFKNNIPKISNDSRYRQNILKIRQFMGLCETILTKNNISKEKHKSFREWHLQTVLRNLETLSEDQKSLVFEQKKLAVNILIRGFLNSIQQVFYALKSENVLAERVNKFFYSCLRIKKFIEKMCFPYLRATYQIFPNANFGNLQKDMLTIYKMAQFMAQLKSKTRAVQAENQEDHKKVEAISRIFDVFNGRITIAFQIFLKKINTISIIVGAEKRENLEENISGTESLFCTLQGITQRRLYSIFSELRQYHTRASSTRISQIYSAIARLKNILDEKQLNLLKLRFFLWKQYSALPSTANLNKLQIKNGFLILMRILKGNLYTCLQKMKQAGDLKIKANYIEEIKEPDPILINIISNQAVVNNKLENKHKKRNELYLQLKQRPKQIAKLSAILIKVCFRHREGLKKWLRRWEEKVSFKNTEVKEYRQLLTILENEMRTLTGEIQDIRFQEPESPNNEYASNRRSEYGKQIKYLEFLEIQNSNIMEFLKQNEKEREEIDDYEDILNEIEIKKSRTYSIQKMSHFIWNLFEFFLFKFAFRSL